MTEQCSLFVLFTIKIYVVFKKYDVEQTSSFVLHVAVVFSNIMVYIRTASRGQHFLRRLRGGEGYAKKGTLCTLEKMSTIMDKP